MREALHSHHKVCTYKYPVYKLCTFIFCYKQKINKIFLYKTTIVRANPDITVFAPNIEIKYQGPIKYTLPNTIALMPNDHIIYLY
jgi:hypothetical protein